MSLLKVDNIYKLRKTLTDVIPNILHNWTN